MAATSGLNSFAPRKSGRVVASKPNHFFASRRTYGDTDAHFGANHNAAFRDKNCKNGAAREENCVPDTASGLK